VFPAAREAARTIADPRNHRKRRWQQPHGRARDGTTQKIGLASDVVVTDLVKTTLADVKPRLLHRRHRTAPADGSQKAIAIHIFPDIGRVATAEGFSPV